VPADPIRELLKKARQSIATGNLREAAQPVRQALEKSPDHARANLVMGLILREMGDVPQALKHLENAAAADPGDAEIQFTLANTLHMAPQRRGEAKPVYQVCLELAPDSVPALAALAKLHEELGEFDEARAAANRALEHAPDHPSSRLVIALVDWREGKLEDARASFESLIVAGDGALASRLPPATRATALNRYATTLDGLGAHEDAATFFDRAQRVRWSCPDAASARPNQPLKVLEDTRRTVTPEMLQSWHGAAFDDGLADPCFVVGFPRSGASPIERVLAAHPGVATLDENSPLAEVLPRIAARASAGTYPTALPKIRDEFILELRALYAKSADARLERSRGESRGGRLLVDKSPMTVIHLPVIARLFPRARVIMAVRDPRDACLSSFMQLAAPSNSTAHFRSVESAARFYTEVMGRWLETRETFPLPWIESRYEDLVRDPAAGARGLVEFLGLSWDDGAADSGVHAGSVGRWRHYAPQFGPVSDALAPFLDAFGYER